MATRRPAKIASQKLGKAEVRHCPECDTEMQISKIIRASGPSGMFWLCTNNSCGTVVSTAGAKVGQLDLK